MAMEKTTFTTVFPKKTCSGLNTVHSPDKFFGKRFTASKKLILLRTKISILLYKLKLFLCENVQNV